MLNRIGKSARNYDATDPSLQRLGCLLIGFGIGVDVAQYVARTAFLFTILPLLLGAALFAYAARRGKKASEDRGEPPSK